MSGGLSTSVDAVDSAAGAAPADATPAIAPALPSTPIPRRSRLHRRAKYLLIAADAAAVGLAIVFAMLAADLYVTTRGDRSTAAAVVAATPLVWLLFLARQRLYHARHLSRRLEEFRRLVGASGMSVGALAIGVYALDAPVSRSWLATVAAASIVTLTIEREAARRVFARLRRSGRIRRAVVVVGGNQEALELARHMDADPMVGYEVVGFATDTPLELVDDEVRARHLGTLDDITDIVDRTGAVGVVIASTAVTTYMSNRLTRHMIRHGVHVELSSTLRDVAAERLTVTGIGQFPMLYVSAVRQSGWRMVAKRVFDIAVSSVVLAASAPVLVLIALAVKISSPGPVLFRQVRLGKGGEPFEVLKFRTMVQNAEEMLIDLTDHNEADGPLFKMRNDPRVTRLGRVLRHLSLDELPQLWNVLRGEMSLVGPRPALPEEAVAWSPELHNRLDVQPGITGMWQVNGRSNTTFDDYVRLDLYYVDNWSLITDLAILARTVPAVLLRHGAM